MNPEDPLVVWPIGGSKAVFERHGEDEAVVVVGVLPDQVDPARGKRHPDRRCTELTQELGTGRGSSLGWARGNHWMGW
jgi:hypothetical protein